MKNYGLCNHKELPNMIKLFQKINNNDGAIALILVILITTLTLVSSVIVSLNNISDLLSNYHLSEAEGVRVDIDACIDDALGRISKDLYVSGNFNLVTTDVTCSSTVSQTVAGLKTATSTATSTNEFGSWIRSVVIGINVSTSPILVTSYKDDINK